jgi:hypothetical protein
MCNYTCKFPRDQSSEAKSLRASIRSPCLTGEDVLQQKALIRSDIKIVAYGQCLLLIACYYFSTVRSEKTGMRLFNGKLEGRAVKQEKACTCMRIHTIHVHTIDLYTHICTTHMH